MNKKRKCKFCGNHTESFIKVPAGVFCDFDHATRFAQEKQKKQAERQAAKARAKQRKEEKAKRADIRARKEALKTAGDYIKEAQAAVNRYVRARDYGKPCISCGAMPEQKMGGTMDAGHYRSRGAAGHLRFNTDNIHGQCVKCNRFRSGNAQDFRISLIEKIGVDRVERLENDNHSRRFTIDYLKRIKRIFNKRANRMEKRRGMK